MRVTQVSYTKTRQVAKYEPERIELVITLEDGESVQEAVRRARLTAAVAMGDITLDEIEARKAELKDELITLDGMELL